MVCIVEQFRVSEPIRADPAGTQLQQIDSRSAFEDWLFGFVRDRVPRGAHALASSAELFCALGNPQDTIPAVHVVGTAGKGTVAASITAGLVSAGESVATHLSPHVHDVRERFLLNGELPNWDQVLGAGRVVAAVIAELGESPTFFAVSTAIAVVLGVRTGADRLVVEAGIGGRFDATNVFRRRDVITVLTAIGIDHTDVLGTSVEEIAAEKAAVLANRRRAVLGPQDYRAHHVVQRMAGTFGVELLEVASRGDSRFDALATANAALAELGAAPVEGLQALPGRFEKANLGDRLVILDGAHNPMKLADLRRRLIGHRVGAVVVAVGVGKDLLGCAAELGKFAMPTKLPEPTEASGLPAVAGATTSTVFVATQFGPPDGSHGPSSHPAWAIVETLRSAGVVEAHAEPDMHTAMVLAHQQSAPGSTVVVTGSFMHLGSALCATGWWPPPD